MASRSLRLWRTDRTPRLRAFEAQCAAATDPDLADECLRGYVLLLSAHFQGFCRSLHAECAAAVVATLPAPVRSVVATQFEAGLALTKTNAHLKTLREDFDRFGIDLNALFGRDPANAPRVTHLGQLNAWRNHAAHSNSGLPASGPLTLAGAQAWAASCDGLATELDGVMYNALLALLGVAPW